jgi:signal peptidase I
MFGFLQSEEKRMRQQSAQWLETAERVYDYRRDQLSVLQLSQLQTAVDELKARLKEKAGVNGLKAGIGKLESVMREVGGRIYPVSSLVENVEFFVVAAIVILGMRAYFIQPFKIPTNSMWPTYYGMTAEVFPEGQEPGLLRKAGRLAALGAINYSLTAPADGEVLVPAFRYGPNTFVAAYSERPGRSFLIFPTVLRDYTFSVGGEQVKLTVPADWGRSEYGFDDVVNKTFSAGESDTLSRAWRKAMDEGRRIETSVVQAQSGNNSIDNFPIYWIPVGKTVRKGDRILSFDILTGDLLFVDRLTYNFFPPKVGQGFVFHTREIAGIGMDQYYVKRLVGLPGDTLEVRRPRSAVTDGAPTPAMRPNEGLLYRNGQPIEGAEAFRKNANKESQYPGYTAAERLGFGQILNIPDNSYFAMGDNSPHSSDSRFWGFVPDKEVVGRPLFIYYPLTKRWGLAR